MTNRVPVWRRGISRKNRDIGAFVRRHSRFVTLAGTFIVFITFIVREGIRDSIKEDISSYEAAEEYYEFQQQVADIQLQLHKIQAENLLTLNRIYPTDVRMASQASINSRIDIVNIRINSVRLLIHSMLGLLDKISDSKRIDAAKQGIAILESAEAEDRLIIDVLAKPSPDLSTKIDNLEARTNELENQTSHVGQNLLANEQKQKAIFENAYETYDFLSYLLFTLGWGVGFVGAWYGIEKPKPAQG